MMDWYWWLYDLHRTLWSQCLALGLAFLGVLFMVMRNRRRSPLPRCERCQVFWAVWPRGCADPGCPRHRLFRNG